MNNTTRFWATIEFLPGQRAAIVALTDCSTGEWACASRVEVRSGSKRDLYNEGYRLASFAAAGKGGTLDRFTVAA